MRHISKLFTSTFALTIALGFPLSATELKTEVIDTTPVAALAPVPAEPATDASATPPLANALAPLVTPGTVRERLWIGGLIPTPFSRTVTPVAKVATPPAPTVVEVAGTAPTQAPTVEEPAVVAAPGLTDAAGHRLGFVTDIAGNVAPTTPLSVIDTEVETPVTQPVIFQPPVAAQEATVTSVTPASKAGFLTWFWNAIRGTTTAAPKIAGVDTAQLAQDVQEAQAKAAAGDVQGAAADLTASIRKAADLAPATLDQKPADDALAELISVGLQEGIAASSTPAPASSPAPLFTQEQLDAKLKERARLKGIRLDRLKAYVLAQEGNGATEVDLSASLIEAAPVEEAIVSAPVPAPALVQTTLKKLPTTPMFTVNLPESRSIKRPSLSSEQSHVMGALIADLVVAGRNCLKPTPPQSPRMEPPHPAWIAARRARVAGETAAVIASDDDTSWDEGGDIIPLHEWPATPQVAPQDEEMNAALQQLVEMENMPPLTADLTSRATSVWQAETVAATSATSSTEAGNALTDSAQFPRLKAEQLSTVKGKPRKAGRTSKKNESKKNR